MLDGLAFDAETLAIVQRQEASLEADQVGHLDNQAPLSPTPLPSWLCFFWSNLVLPHYTVYGIPARTNAVDLPTKASRYPS